MNTTLFFLLPIGMLAIVWSFCFVGACFPTSGLPGTPYSNTILKEVGLVAYWPLSDLPNTPLPTGAPALPPPAPGSTGLGTAVDFTGKNHNGTYIVPPLYISGTTFLTTTGNPPVDRNPALNLHQPSIVPGDGFAQGSKNLPACVDFEGGYVSIPWAANSPSLAEFTLEAWIKPGWTSTAFNWVLFAARTANATGTGFALSINAQNQWEIAVGNGAGAGFTQVNTFVQAPIGVSSGTYIAVTFQSTNGTSGTLSLWIDPASDDTSTPPTPTFSTPATYFPIDTSVAVTFFIGAGDNQNAQTPRTQAQGPGAPLVPYQGLIQSVALYNTALDPTDLASHFADGATSDT
jgi:Concanavalin A-like lectin/glucanases superfamily